MGSESVTVTCYGLFAARPSRYVVSDRTRARDRFLIENPSVDPALLAEELQLSENFIRMRQRKLGLRKCVPSDPRKRQ